MEEVEVIDEIGCLPSGDIQVRKGTYYQKTVTPDEGETTIDEEGNEVASEPVVTKTLLSNWRCVLQLHDEDKANEILGDEANVALAHWSNFPVPEPVEADLPPGVE